ncbi:hypothetical protein BU14_2981s0001 [Porphyra umbilicalis]|uniref:Uncharacterized protein n=1 Tax=Porphyra umbilicalis TaxID=2786 RepID=A0A1X6NIQ9_PORUM|nr:hypothetical protein BU14_2981s0001 [Porphyra umbilicalis]|eukprot:OSX68336.1 hypothetical protein BU14_2981s0001 [Porphyra umbilicalis]
MGGRGLAPLRDGRLSLTADSALDRRLTLPVSYLCVHRPRRCVALLSFSLSFSFPVAFSSLWHDAPTGLISLPSPSLHPRRMRTRRSRPMPKTRPNSSSASMTATARTGAPSRTPCGRTCRRRSPPSTRKSRPTRRPSPPSACRRRGASPPSPPPPRPSPCRPPPRTPSSAKPNSPAPPSTLPARAQCAPPSSRRKRCCRRSPTRGRGASIPSFPAPPPSRVGSTARSCTPPGRATAARSLGARRGPSATASACARWTCRGTKNRRAQTSASASRRAAGASRGGAKTWGPSACGCPATGSQALP